MKISDTKFNELLLNTRGGSEEAASALVTLYSPKIIRFIDEEFAGQDIDGDELVNETWREFLLHVDGEQYESINSVDSLVECLTSIAKEKASG